ncbi:MAG TPA: putative cytokinetic ring protein SteA, partial [Actinomycetota bacterium]|nr:putative cytokinetic ring protein SteA [Actinomycetota bacterium]
MIRWARRKRPSEPPEPGVIRGTARVDHRTKNLLVRLLPGDVAAIDHEDIDRIAAEGLIQRGPAAVVNARRSSTGRYPNLGPLLLVSAGIPVIDDVGPEVMDIPEGATLLIEDGRIYRDEIGRVEVGKGTVLTLDAVEHTLDQAKQGIATEIERFAENTIGYIKDERDVLIEGVRLP